MHSGIRTCALFVAALIIIGIGPRPAGAQDRWLGADKAKHFGAMTAVAVGGYALAAPVTRRGTWRMAIGVGTGVGAASAKELWDRSRGDPSWRDFAWGAAGSTAGVLIARAIDKMWGK